MNNTMQFFIHHNSRMKYDKHRQIPSVFLHYKTHPKMIYYHKVPHTRHFLLQNGNDRLYDAFH